MPRWAGSSPFSGFLEDAKGSDLPPVSVGREGEARGSRSVGDEAASVPPGVGPATPARPRRDLETGRMLPGGGLELKVAGPLPIRIIRVDFIPSSRSE